MGWKGELGQQRTAQNTRCQRLALFFPPRGGRATIFLFQPQTPKRGFGRGAGLAAGAHRVPSTKTPATAKGSRKRMNATESAPRSPQQKTPPDGRGLVCKRELLLGGDEHARTHGGA